MKKDEVPQEKGLFGNYREVQYAVDEEGHYTKTPSAGWDAKGIANSQYWRVLEQQVFEVLAEIESGKASPLKFYMTVDQMDPALLANYVGLSKWRVKRHMKARVFAKCKSDVLQRYADIFAVSVEQLKQTPEDFERWANIRQWAHRYDFEGSDED